MVSPCGPSGWRKAAGAAPFGKGDEPSYEITAQELGALLSGIALSVARGRKRYQRKCTEAA
jgi:hypothetical protein